MSMMDKLKQMLKGHESQADKGIDAAGDFVDKKTGGKYEKHVDTAQDKMRNEFGAGGEKKTGGGRNEEPPQR